MKKARLFLVFALIGVVALTGCSSNNGEDIKNGVNDMMKVTAELQEQLNANNAEKIKEYGHELEEVWEKFEDGVKDKYPESYEEVEDALEPTIAGTEANTLDVDVVTTFNNQLIKALNDLSGKIK